MQGHFSQYAYLFPDRVSSNLWRCPLNVSTYERDPYVRIERKMNKVSYSGLEVKIVRGIAEALNASVQFVDVAPRSDNLWGRRLVNGSITGITGDVLTGKSDIAFSYMPKGFDVLESILESTISYIDSKILWYVPCAKPRQRRESFIRMFSVSLWLLIIIVYMLISLLTWRIGVSGTYHQEESRLYSNIFQTFQTVFAIFIGSSIEVPHSTQVRIVISFWLWYSFAFNIIFQTFYTSFLVDPGFIKQIENLDELLMSDLKMSYVIEFDYLFRDRGDGREAKILRRRSYCRFLQQCLSNVAVNSDTATISDNLDVRYRMKKSKLLCTLNEEIFKYNIAMYLNKGNPLLARINIIIRRLMESGILEQWFKEYDDEFGRMHDDNDQDDSSEYFVFTVSHLFLVFICLLSGYLLSSIAFIFEQMIFMILRNKSRDAKTMGFIIMEDLYTDGLKLLIILSILTVFYTLSIKQNLFYMR
ncbi:hypothetical protein L9F63_015313 [Diploptera punctata]|uniref:Ionotropic glutamate receptor C-terminal domain-containing protein n=1 Tax=Diploptera punctata TaxID=6984 RepID=A0AAD8A5J3_DIPPU|nr:hypothetical protein L9F63_015313 [Diploptera punctata]